MDTLAHAMFGGALRKVLRESKKDGGSDKKLSKKQFFWSAFWGAFPDLFAFGIGITVSYVAVGKLFGGVIVSGQPLTGYLYQYSHSLIIAAAIIILIRLIIKRWPWVLLGWPLHILFDIPTHDPTRFPTPFLFPISDWTFPWGIQWSTPWFWITTWVVIVIIYVGFVVYDRKKKML